VVPAGGSAAASDSMSQSFYILKCLAEGAQFKIHQYSQFDPHFTYTPPIRLDTINHDPIIYKQYPYFENFLLN
jgi:hypothetical protein